MSKSKQQLYICPYEGFKAKNKKDLATHVVRNHPLTEGLYECPYCDYRSNARSRISLHILSDHGNLRKKSGIFWKKYKCSFCNFKYRAKRKHTFPGGRTIYTAERTAMEYINKRHYYYRMVI